MQALAAAVAAYLKDRNLQYEYEEERGFFQIILRYEKLENIEVLIQISDGDVAFRAILPERVPEEKRGAACRFLARANSRLALGCLEMDLRDGETQARSVICGGGRVPGPEEIDAHMQTCVRALDRCGEGLLRLLRGEMDERQAFALCFAR